MVDQLRPVIIAAVQEDPKWISVEASKHVRSWAGAPLIVGGQVIGILSLDHVDSGFYRPTHAQSLAIFATQAAMALQNAQFYQAARSHAQENETMREAVAALTSALDLEHVLDSILTQLKRVVKHDSAAIFLVENDSLRIVAGRGFLNVDQVIGSTFPLENPLVLEAQRNHAPLAIADATQDPRYQGWGGTVNTRGWLGVPLMIRREMIGFLTLDSSEPNIYGEAETSLAWTFAHQAAIAIDNARLFKQVHRLAIIDTLTGIYNRRHFFELASLEFERARRYSHPLTMVMWDIDHFKIVNDTFGHIVGDHVLQMVAERSQNNLREVDILGRYGGEEFVALLGEADRVLGKDVAERLRVAIGEKPFLVNGREINVTISIGIADISDCSNLEILLDRADQALYQAKQGGRNQVRIWEEAAHLMVIGK
jgi:diguanylate cyclase (GGDEF)-like protein